jgi:hypothetical protein
MQIFAPLPQTQRLSSVSNRANFRRTRSRTVLHADRREDDLVPIGYVGCKVIE